MGRGFATLAVLAPLLLALAWGVRAVATVVATAYIAEAPSPTRGVVRGPTGPAYDAVTAPAVPASPDTPR